MMPQFCGFPVLYHACRTRRILDGQYAAFGKVIEGMDVVDEIAQTPTGFQDRPLKPVVMKKVEYTED